MSEADICRSDVRLHLFIPKLHMLVSWMYSLIQSQYME